MRLLRSCMAAVIRLRRCYGGQVPRYRAVGIFGGEKTAFFRRHVASDVIENVARDCFVLLIFCDLESVEIGDGELRLIVKHFLEVRHVPVTIDRVTMKPAADVIVHSARSHFAQREQRHVERLFARIALGIAGVESREKIERDWPRKFWRITESAFLWVITAINLPVRGI